MGNLRMISSNGWQSSVVGENVVEKLLKNKDWTVKQLKYAGLMVSADCRVSINGGEPFFVDHRLGINHTTEFEPIKSLVFDTDGISYFILSGY